MERSRSRETVRSFFLINYFPFSMIHHSLGEIAADIRDDSVKSFHQTGFETVKI